MRILIVSYHLHPDATSEGICVAKTARALRDAGHEVEIVTSTLNRLDGAYCVPRTTFLRDIPVHRVTADASCVPAWARAFYAASRLPAGGRRVREQILGRVSAVPNLLLGCGEREYAWAEAAARKIVELCASARGGYDVIHSRLNHAASHTAVLRALPRLGRGVRWSAHFSDPWPHHLYPAGYESKVGPLARRRLEAVLDEILTRADSLTFPSERLASYMLSGRRAGHRAKAHAVPHLGNFWLGGPAYARGEKFKIVFTGFVLKQRRPDNFLAALRRLIDRDPASAGAISATFVGRNMPLVDEAVARLGLGRVVTTAPHSAFEDVWALTTGADVLLLVESQMDEGVFMPSKLADCLSAGRPILALSPRVGVVSDYLKGGGGVVADPDSPEEIERALGLLFGRWREGRLDEFAPPAATVGRVSPAAVVPAYEAAFLTAEAKRPAARERGLAGLMVTR